MMSDQNSKFTIWLKYHNMAITCRQPDMMGNEEEEEAIYYSNMCEKWECAKKETEDICVLKFHSFERS